jgi:hypothetical protein
MRTPARTQTSILRYGVHHSITSRNPRIGYSANVSQLKFLDQLSAIYIVVLLGHPLVIPCLWSGESLVTGHGICIHNLSIFFFLFRLGLFWGGYTLHILTYTCYLHIRYLNLMAGRVRPGGTEVNKTGMIKN